jgi:hypothetical protein
MSDDGGVTPSEEAEHVSPGKVTTPLGKGAQDTWRTQTSLPGLGLIKPSATRSKGLWSEVVSKPGITGGACEPALKPQGATGRLTDERPRFRTGLGKSDRPGS